MSLTKYITLAVAIMALNSCGPSAEEKAALQMNDMLQSEQAQNNNPENIFNATGRMTYLNEALKTMFKRNGVKIQYPTCWMITGMLHIFKANHTDQWMHRPG